VQWSSSLPTSTSRAWSPTRPFPVPEGGHRSIGTRWVHGSLRVQPVQAVGQVVQLLGEQVPIAVQGDRRRLVSQVVLHGLDAGALADQQARAGMPQVMDSQGSGQASSPGGRLEVALGELRLPQRPTLRHREHQIARCVGPVGQVGADLLTQESRPALRPGSHLRPAGGSASSGLVHGGFRLARML
jgi:hypothetical protein